MVPLFSTLSSIAKHPCLRCWRREKSWCSKSTTGTAWNENRGYLRDTVVKTFGSIYNEFLPTKIRNVQENEVREAHEVPTRQGGAPYRGGASCPFRTTSFFLKFLNNPKLIKIAIGVVLESVYLPYHIPIPFRSLERSEKCPLCIP